MQRDAGGLHRTRDVGRPGRARKAASTPTGFRAAMAGGSCYAVNLHQAINWMRSVKALAPEMPFFMYFAPGAVHAPHHVPKEWIAKSKGEFDGGWEKLRENTLSTQIAWRRPERSWRGRRPSSRIGDSLSADEKRLFARQMEVFTGFGEYTDREIGRAIQAVADKGRPDNTLMFYIVGDNGASAEGGAKGLIRRDSYFNGVAEP
jgi:arylsulfatase A-like enzyme